MLRLPRLPARPRRVRHAVHLEGVLGTSLELQVVAGTEQQGRAAETAVLVEIDRLEAIFNAYRPTSELRRWQQTHDEDVPVSPELFRVLSAAEEWRSRTNGAFNPAVEAFTRQWADLAAKGAPAESFDPAPILRHMATPLWQLNPSHSIARRLTSLPVTLNSIAKGFIIDSACEIASASPGVHEVLLNIGGDLRHSGSKPTPVSIADPFNDAENAPPTDRIQLSNAAVATSGNYRRGFQIGSRWYSHVLDPRTGYPVEHHIGVSVLAPNTTTADVLATAFSVLDPLVSLQIADSYTNIGALIIAADGERHSNPFWNAARL